MKKVSDSPVVLDSFDCKYMHDKDRLVVGWKVSLARNPVLTTLYGEIIWAKIDGFEYLVQVANGYQTDNSLVNRVKLKWITRSK